MRGLTSSLGGLDLHADFRFGFATGTVVAKAVDNSTTYTIPTGKVLALLYVGGVGASASQFKVDSQEWIIGNSSQKVVSSLHFNRDTTDVLGLVNSANTDFAHADLPVLAYLKGGVVLSASNTNDQEFAGYLIDEGLVP